MNASTRLSRLPPRWIGLGYLLAMRPAFIFVGSYLFFGAHCGTWLGAVYGNAECCKACVYYLIDSGILRDG